jgi:hypothetical protein
MGNTDGCKVEQRFKPLIHEYKKKVLELKNKIYSTYAGNNCAGTPLPAIPAHGFQVQ